MALQHRHLCASLILLLGIARLSSGTEFIRTNDLSFVPSAYPLTNAIGEQLSLRLWLTLTNSAYDLTGRSNVLTVTDQDNGSEYARSVGVSSNPVNGFVLFSLQLPQNVIGEGEYDMTAYSYATNGTLIAILDRANLFLRPGMLVAPVQVVATGAAPSVAVTNVVNIYSTTIVNNVTEGYTQAVTNVISMAYTCAVPTISESVTGNTHYFNYCGPTNGITNILPTIYTTNCASNVVTFSVVGNQIQPSACLTNGAAGGASSFVLTNFTTNVDASGFTLSNAIELSVYRRFNHGQSNTLGTNVAQAFLATTGGIISNSAKRAAIIASLGNTIDNQDTAAIIASRNSLVGGGSQYGGSIVSGSSAVNLGSVSFMAACYDSNLGWWVNPAYAFQIGGENAYYNDAYRGGIIGGFYNHVQDGSAHGPLYDALVLVGQYNTVTNGGHRSMVVGGQYNIAALEDSFAAGWAASATSRNSFVWNARSGTRTATTGSNQFLIGASGGVGLPIIATNATALANPPEGIVLHYFFTNATTTNEEWRFPDGNVKVRSM